MARPAKLIEVSTTSLILEFNRHSNKFIDELAQSLSEHGLFSPPLVIAHGEHYKVISGNGRVRAAMQLGWQRIKVFLAEDLDQATQLIIGVAANTLNEHMSVPDLAEKIEEIRLATGWSVAKIVKVLPGKKVSEAKASLAQTAMASVSPDARPILEGAPMFVWFGITRLPAQLQAESAKQCLAEKWTRETLHAFVKDNTARPEKKLRIGVPHGYDAAKEALKDLLARLSALEKQGIDFKLVPQLLKG